MKLNKAVVLVKKAALESDKLANTILGEYGLTPSQYKVLKYIYGEAENGVRIKDLEIYYSMSHPTAIGIVQNLEKKGLVEYRDNPEDHRSRFIVPSEKALQQEKDLEEVGIVLEKQFTEKLSEEERKELVRLLRKLMGLKEEKEGIK